MNKKYYDNKIKALAYIYNNHGICEKCNSCMGVKGSHFHHMDATTKLYNVSDLLLKAWDDIAMAEVRKCIVLCPTCHSNLHRNYGYKYKVTKEDTENYIFNK